MDDGHIMIFFLATWLYSIVGFVWLKELIQFNQERIEFYEQLWMHIQNRIEKHENYYHSEDEEEEE